MSYVYIETEHGILWTVGFYKPDGKFESESDHSNRDSAGERVNYLNGGTGIDQDCLSQLGADISNHLARQ